MRTRIAVIAAAMCLLGTVVWGMASKQKTDTVSADSAAKPAADEKGWKLAAYYLHGNFRCARCISMETQAKEAVEKDFAAEIKQGKVAFAALNYEVPENAHFATDYKLTTKSLVLSLRKDGKEVKWKNLPEIWTRVGNPPAYREYVDAEVKAMLKEMI